MALIDLEQLPPVLIAGGPADASSTGRALGMAASGGLASAGAMLTRAVEVQNHTPYSTLVWLTQLTADTRRAYQRSASWLGRVLNYLTGAKPYYIGMSGHHFAQLCHTGALNFEGNMPGAQIRCGLRLDVAEEALDELRSRFEAEKEGTRG